MADTTKTKSETKSEIAVDYNPAFANNLQWKLPTSSGTEGTGITMIDGAVSPPFEATLLLQTSQVDLSTGNLLMPNTPLKNAKVSVAFDRSHSYIPQTWMQRLKSIVKKPNPPEFLAVTPAYTDSNGFASVRFRLQANGWRVIRAVIWVGGASASIPIKVI